MNELLTKFWPSLKLLILPYAVLMFLLLYPINYYVFSPGGLAEVDKTIDIDYNEDKVITGSFSTTYIMDVRRPTFFEFIVSYFSRYTDIGELSGSAADYTNSESIKISYLDKAASVDAAIVVAYETISALNPDIHLSYANEAVVFGKYEYLSFYDDIGLGDQFISMIGDGDVLVEPIEQIQSDTCVPADADDDDVIDEYCTTSTKIRYFTLLADTYAFTFENEDGEQYTLSLSKDPTSNLFGLVIADFYVVDQDQTTPAYTQLPSSIGGPSGGLLMTLYIYNMLSEEDITHGLKIAGTGTINYDGSVGLIGGVKQKVATAYLNHVDLFFMPHLSDYSNDNYIEALAACEELGIDPEGWLIPVASFTEAIDYLTGWGD